MSNDFDDIFEEEAARQRAAAEAEDADPVLQAKIATERKAEEERIDREIAAGLRDPDGEWIETEESNDEEEEPEE